MRQIQEEVSSILKECTKKIVESSALNEEHKKIMCADLRKLEQSYLTKQNWDAYPQSYSDIERSKAHRAGRALWTGEK